MKISGIYKIESTVHPERSYIGSAVNISERWRTHIKDLKKQRHGNSRLQKHCNKYGISDLKFSILLGCDKEDLIKTEQYFIDSYNPWFNIRKYAGSNLGLKRSEDYSPWNKGKKGLQVAWNKGLKGYGAGRKVSKETCEKHRFNNLKNGNIPPSQKGKIRKLKVS